MKFNVHKNNHQQKNYEGEQAYALSPEMGLFTAAVTATLENRFYESSNDRMLRLRQLISNCKPDFVAKLAIYCRQVMNLRSVPIVLVVELARYHRGDNLVSKTLEQVIQRADELAEVLACYQALNQREQVKKLNRLSKQVQKGVAKAFLKFDEYQLAKYNRKAEVTLKDALFLAHPKAKTDEQQALFDKIVQGKLETPYTWEVELSQLGQQSFEKKEDKQAAIKAKWAELIRSKKLGYMALLRNLRNILQAGIETDELILALDYLSDSQAVQRSKQLPFRFLSAYQELKSQHFSHQETVLEALEEAVKISAGNIKGFDQNTRVLIACDVSGSMFSPVSRKSTVSLYDIGLLLGMLLQSRCDNVMTGIFGNTWLPYELPKTGILHNVTQLKEIAGKVGYATNGYKVVQFLNAKKIIMDKVMLFTDMQLWNSQEDGRSLNNEWIKYKTTIAPKAKLYLFDLAGYGHAPLPLQIENNDVFLLSGWNDKVFDVLEILDEGVNALAKIDAIALP